MATTVLNGITVNGESVPIKVDSKGNITPDNTPGEGSSTSSVSSYSESSPMPVKLCACNSGMVLPVKVVEPSTIIPDKLTTLILAENTNGDTLNQIKLNSAKSDTTGLAKDSSIGSLSTKLDSLAKDSTLDSFQKNIGSQADLKLTDPTLSGTVIALLKGLLFTLLNLLPFGAATTLAKSVSVVLSAGQTIFTSTVLTVSSTDNNVGSVALSQLGQAQSTYGQIKTNAGRLTGYSIYNSNTLTTVYVKFYDLNRLPTITDVPFLRLALPANSQVYLIDKDAFPHCVNGIAVVATTSLVNNLLAFTGLAATDVTGNVYYTK